MSTSAKQKNRPKTASKLYQNRNTPYFTPHSNACQIGTSSHNASMINNTYDNNLSLQDEWVAVSYDLSDEDREFLLRGARVLANRNILLRSIRESNDKPNLYQSSSRNVSLVDFIKSEWLDKGWKPSDIERSVVQEYDPKLLKAVTDYENKRCELLPNALRFKKSRNRVSRAELISERPKRNSASSLDIS